MKKRMIGNSTRLWAACIALATLLCPGLSAQSGFQGLALPKTVNSEHDEGVPRLSPDGQTLYFMRLQHPGNVGGQDIWWSAKDANGNWTEAVNAGTLLNNAHHNFVGAVLEGGDALMLGNTYGPTAKDVRPGIAVSRRAGNGWGSPQTVVPAEALPKGSRFLDFHASADGGVIIVSVLDIGSGNEDLAACRRTGAGTYGPAVSLGSDINTDGYETAPFLAADGKTLYFTSNGRGGLGDGDIYTSTRLDDSWTRWSAPQNLGPAVNTAGFDGHFVVDAQQDRAYFVSGPSAGALGDIYAIDLALLRGEPQPVARHTLRTPRNTAVDFRGAVEGLSMAETRRRHAAKEGPKAELLLPAGIDPTFIYQPAPDFVGMDSVGLYGECADGETPNCLLGVLYVEVYAADTAPLPVQAMKTRVNVSGTVTDEATGQPVDGDLAFYDAADPRQPIAVAKADPGTGMYTVELPAGKEILVEATHPYYLTMSTSLSTAGKAAVKGQVQHDVAMTPKPMEVGHTFVLKNIYFDLDKSTLKPESKEELTRLYDLLRHHPTIEIEVKGHTDASASEAYNQKLSESRAAAVTNYLKYKGVMGYRLQSKGFGEKVPVATNATAEGRALNRRVEFTIVKI